MFGGNCLQVQHGAASAGVSAHAERDECSQNTPTGRHLLPHQHPARRTVLATSTQATQTQGASQLTATFFQDIEDTESAFSENK